MFSQATIEAASDTLTSVAVASIVSIVRMTDRYKENPAYFSDLQQKIEAVDGAVKAKQLNAALTELENLGVGEVEINQAQTVGTDGVVYSKVTERAGLVDYILGVLYEAYSPSIYPNTSTDVTIRGNYGVGRLPIDYEGTF